MVTLFIEQHEYIKALSPAAGVRVLIHHQYQQPFPEEDGFDISPGQKTTVALRMVSSCYKYLNLFALYFYLCFSIRYSYDFGDGPFDIQGGGGLGFFLPTSYFFSLFAKQVIFFKSKLNMFFLFFSKNNTLKSEKCKRKQHIE